MQLHELHLWTIMLCVCVCVHVLVMGIIPWHALLREVSTVCKYKKEPDYMASVDASQKWFFAMLSCPKPTPEEDNDGGSHNSRPKPARNPVRSMCPQLCVNELCSTCAWSSTQCSRQCVCVCVRVCVCARCVECCNLRSLSS